MIFYGLGKTTYTKHGQCVHNSNREMLANSSIFWNIYTIIDLLIFLNKFYCLELYINKDLLKSCDILGIPLFKKYSISKLRNSYPKKIIYVAALKLGL